MTPCYFVLFEGLPFFKSLNWPPVLFNGNNYHNYPIEFSLFCVKFANMSLMYFHVCFLSQIFLWKLQRACNFKWYSLWWYETIIMCLIKHISVLKSCIYAFQMLFYDNFWCCLKGDQRSHFVIFCIDSISHWNQTTTRCSTHNCFTITIIDKAAIFFMLVTIFLKWNKIENI